MQKLRLYISSINTRLCVIVKKVGTRFVYKKKMAVREGRRDQRRTRRAEKKIRNESLFISHYLTH